MDKKNVKIGNVTVTRGGPLVLIAGPCVIESEESVMEHARRLKDIAREYDMPFIFKASYDKANRSSIDSYRGPGIEEGLGMLRKVKEDLGIPVTSDVHLPAEAIKAAEVLDLLQVPAFLCRQTDLLVAAAGTGKAVNVKKGQFMSPKEMDNVVKKLESSGTSDILLTERGTTFGYNMLVNDFRSIVMLGETGYPVVYDATHSVQMPGGMGTSSGGDSVFVEPLSMAAVACGCDVLFLEVHATPEQALSDGANMISLDGLGALLDRVKKIEKAVGK